MMIYYLKGFTVFLNISDKKRVSTLSLGRVGRDEDYPDDIRIPAIVWTVGRFSAGGNGDVGETGTRRTGKMRL